MAARLLTAAGIPCGVTLTVVVSPKTPDEVIAASSTTYEVPLTSPLSVAALEEICADTGDVPAVTVSNAPPELMRTW